MSRVIDDNDYLSYLPTSLHVRRYELWKKRMLGIIENVVSDLNRAHVSEVMKKYNLTAKDIALLVRLKYVTEEEATTFGLKAIEESVPL